MSRIAALELSIAVFAYWLENGFVLVFKSFAGKNDGCLRKSLQVPGLGHMDLGVRSSTMLLRLLV